MCYNDERKGGFARTAQRLEPFRFWLLGQLVVCWGDVCYTLSASVLNRFHLFIT